MAKRLREEFSDAATVTLDHLAPRTSARRGSPIVKELAGKAGSQRWREDRDEHDDIS